MTNVDPITNSISESEFIKKTFKEAVTLNDKSDTKEAVEKVISEAKSLPKNSSAFKSMSDYDGQKGLSATDAYFALVRHAKLSFGEGYSAAEAYQDAISNDAPKVNICDPALDFQTAIRQFLKSLGRTDEWIHNKKEKIEWVADHTHIFDLNGRYISGSEDLNFHEDFQVGWTLLRKIGPYRIFDYKSFSDRDKKEWIYGYSVDHASLLKYLEPIKGQCKEPSEENSEKESK